MLFICLTMFRILHIDIFFKKITPSNNSVNPCIYLQKDKESSTKKRLLEKQDGHGGTQVHFENIPLSERCQTGMFDSVQRKLPERADVQKQRGWWWPPAGGEEREQGTSVTSHSISFESDDTCI